MSLKILKDPVFHQHHGFADPGIVYHRIKRAKFIAGRLHQSFDWGCICNVRSKPLHIRAKGFRNRVSRL